MPKGGFPQLIDQHQVECRARHVGLRSEQFPNHPPSESGFPDTELAGQPGLLAELSRDFMDVKTIAEDAAVTEARYRALCCVVRAGSVVEPLPDSLSKEPS